MPKPPIFYTDTSVFGGVFDSEFSDPSRDFFDQMVRGVIGVAISPIVIDELRKAPDDVIAFFEKLRPQILILDIDADIYELRDAYIAAEIVGDRWRADALHVAAATVGRCQGIVSWNFKHIVNYRRIPMYNGINMTRGYGQIAIHTPSEISLDEETE